MDEHCHGRDEWSNVLFTMLFSCICLLLLCFRCISILCCSWTKSCCISIFNSLNALTLKHVPWLWTNVCIVWISKYIYMMYFQVYAQGWTQDFKRGGGGVGVKQFFFFFQIRIHVVLKNYQPRKIYKNHCFFIY